MKSMQKLFSRENLKTFLIWNVGAFITAVGAYFFKYPNHFSFGGVSGITVVLGHYFPELSLGGINWVLNLALLVLGAVMLGKSFGVSTAYVTVSMSAFLSLFEVLFPMSQPLTDQPLLELIFGVLLPSVGAAVLFNVGASTGGTDIIAMILKKYTSADIGSALFLADFFIAAAAFPAFGATTGLFPALTLGCGAVGGSSSSNNISPMDLINIRRVAWNTEETPAKSAPEIARVSPELVELLTQKILEQLG